MKRIVGFICAGLISGLVQAQWLDEGQESLGPLVPGEPVERVLFDSRPVGEGSDEAPPSEALARRQADSEALVAISRKLRLHVGKLAADYPRNAEVVIEAALFPNGRALFPRVARSSGYKALDEAVLQALRRAEPLPVPPSMIEADAGQLIRLVFRPHPRS
ncbi:MAG: hypothetical protein CGU28_05925 [Candidatus Dactylopiibacterium carminicum]|uniref:TonB C-terminal domain-containing protein n=1 Tax=Candidatus Dactylopiibacterium carminicum TaxID=857335 RepID=A0A272EQT2_9RHOO|nr:TonB family protein [Candidatus Dactylopiibacterium carminicum]KAF7599286.1 TonB C-terminal domain-containing protein [Candidatus Dactylopiibacterium carminicum]PAS92448.1 MAG: hypothetical protein CGU29_11615 [Candidatus Dactylopiibacterium carminicum]PAS97164.1 MAG: hypothetical protein CGU28_05925 [Candidatus Dactylopiibacterium carminicum]PAS99292.1 MAG: hypothetical protein BSR46_08930 [Candidatus Dactylopiibacterium carminicum]